MRTIFAACAGVGMSVALAATASEDHHTPTQPTHEEPAEAAPPPPAEVQPPPQEERGKARDVVVPLRDDRPPPASRTALDRARRNADEGVPLTGDRSLDAMSNEDLNQILVGGRGQKVIIRDYSTGGQTSRSITVMDNDVSASQGQGSKACSSVGAIGDDAGCR